jgi:uroporphyrinogen III methyltransferase / synthase
VSGKRETTGRVILVGAGPGDPDLLTVRALRELESADVLLYDALISPAILALARPDCQRVDVGKRGDGSRGVPQERIAELMIAHARSGARVVRLKGGDPFVFGRGGEEASALAEAGIAFEIVPGISSSTSVPAYAGIPVTDRRLSSSFTVVTGHRGKAVDDERTDWEGLARSSETLVVLMGTAWLEDLVERILAGGRDPQTPAAVISQGTTGSQRTVVAPLGEVASRVREAGLAAPSIIVVGEVVRFRESVAWFERRPLFGRRVLVLRSQEDAGELVARVGAAGAIPVAVPLLAFSPPADRAALRAALSEALEYDWVLLTSETAVRFSGADLARAIGARELPRIACIGPATARAAQAAGLRVVLTTGGRQGGELLATALGDVSGARILIPRSALATEVLPEALRARGARVRCVEAYRNDLPAGAGAALAAALAAGVDAVLLTSGSTVERLVELCGAAELGRLAGSAALICIGETTAAALRKRGIDPAGVALEPSSAGLLGALERYYLEPHGIS